MSGADLARYANGKVDQGLGYYHTNIEPALTGWSWRDIQAWLGRQYDKGVDYYHGTVEPRLKDLLR